MSSTNGTINGTSNGTTRGAALTLDQARRYARHIILPEVGPVGQQRPPIVMRHELDECLIVRTGQVLEPGRGARMGASPPREWDALVRDIEDECVLERELDLTADAGRRPRHHEPLRFETDQGVVDGRPIDRQGDG